jgi:hypothetical protein
MHMGQSRAQQMQDMYGCITTVNVTKVLQLPINKTPEGMLKKLLSSTLTLLRTSFAVKVQRIDQLLCENEV